MVEFIHIYLTVDYDNRFSIYYQNVRGLRTKSHEFLRNILCNNYDVVCIAESWLNTNFHNSEYFDSRYEVYRCDRNVMVSGYERGGGVLIAVRRDLCPSQRGDICTPRPPLAEEVWLSLPLRSGVTHGGTSSTGIPSRSSSAPHYLHIIATYIAHGNNHESLLTSFYDRVSDLIISNPGDTYLVLGDFNVTYAHWYLDATTNCLDIEINNDSLACLTADFMHLSQLSQYNNLFNINSRLLDLVFSNEHCVVAPPEYPLVPEDPHHKSLEINLKLSFPKTLISASVKKKLYLKADYESIKLGLSDINWDQLFSTMSDVESMTNYLYNILNNLVDKYVPTHNLRNNNKHPPWFTTCLIKLDKEKLKFHKKWKRYGNLRDYQTFSLLRKRFKMMEADCYKKFIELSENKIREHPKLFWSFVKSKNKSSAIPEKMVYKDKIIDSGSEICDAFNQYFHSVFISNPIHKSGNTVRDAHSSTVDINCISINYDNVLKELEHVNTHKGAGSDGIHPILISQCAKELATPITIIFHASIQTGTFPSIWKKSIITPIPKNNRKDRIDEYRPISKLCVLGKILEKIVTAQMSYSFRNLITEEQHGFFKHRSVDTNMVTFTDFLLKAMDNNAQVDVVYTDFSKAFDKISHDLLLEKLVMAGVHGNLLRWIQSYISNRSQAVFVKGYTSQFLPVPSGVPQGSHIGPLLFSLYINDIGDILKNSNHLLYADDTKLFRIVRSIDDCRKLQEDLNALYDYCLSNQLFLNSDKCFTISYTRKRNKIAHDYCINQQVLKRVTSIRDLGIIMDSMLSFNNHIDHVLASAFRNLGFILRISKPFNKLNTLKILYYSFVRSYADFCSVVWSPCYKVHINRIEKLQKKFIKSLNYRYNITNESYTASLKRYRLMSLHNRRKMFDLVFLYKILNNLIDCAPLLGGIPFVSRVRLPLRPSRSKPLFVPPRFHKNYTRNSFVCRSTNVYNKEFTDIDIFNVSLYKLKLIIIQNLGA